MEYKPHQQRVVDEKIELDEKLLKLKAFINENLIFKNLHYSEQERLVRQHDYMSGYSTVLGERISSF